ncbi:hypothetical protein BGAL_0118g00230 [Botrytis galanthina]|uniref:PLAC8 family protein n=1 Tax=Botrytis galanthina TaxID=278940 RepID=A0A4S8R1J8_9HELO|nr:hypothetical protein BGAL_0118g00230 [Botrytis galanthina]
MLTPYKHSFWACCSPVDICMKAWCCPCFVFGRNHYRINNGTDEGYSACNSSCCCWTVLGPGVGLSFILQMLDRQNMQQKHVVLFYSHLQTKKSKLTQSQGLKGDSCGNCLASVWCPCCELMQTSKELDYVLLEKNASTQGYQLQPGMVAGPQSGAYADK